MGSVTFEAVDKTGRFMISDSEGREVTVASGKPFTTDDPAIIRELDAAPHAVRRVKKDGE